MADLSTWAISKDVIERYSLFLIPVLGDLPLQTATGFIIKRSQLYLVTNLHVLTSKDPETGTLANPHAKSADRIRIVHHLVGGRKRQISEPLFSQDGDPRWYEHHEHRVDVALLPIGPQNSDIRIYPLPLLLAEADVSPRPGMEVFIIGYPSGVRWYSRPKWEHATIRQDPDLPDIKNLFFCIDSTAPSGMSEAPVILRTPKKYFRRDGSPSYSEIPLTRFIGIYSATDFHRRLGKVWRPKVIEEIIQAHKLE